MRTSMWSVSPVQVNPSLYPTPPCPEVLGCPPAAQHSLLAPLSAPSSLSTPPTHICLQTHTHRCLWSRVTHTVPATEGTPLEQGLWVPIQNHPLTSLPIPSPRVIPVHQP